VINASFNTESNDKAAHADNGICISSSLLVVAAAVVFLLTPRRIALDPLTRPPLVSVPNGDDNDAATDIVDAEMDVVWKVDGDERVVGRGPIAAARVTTLEPRLILSLLFVVATLLSPIVAIADAATVDGDDDDILADIIGVFASGISLSSSSSSSSSSL
jgi:hypothetical protein